MTRPFHRRTRLAAALALGALALAACGGPPPPTTVTLALTGSADMNGSAPAKVRVVYLGSQARFSTADYFVLAEGAEAALGPDLIAVDDYLLSPGQSIRDARSFDQPVTHVGVVAGYRDIGRAGWRGAAPLVPRTANTVTATVGGSAVAVSASQ